MDIRKLPGMRDWPVMVVLLLVPFRLAWSQQPAGTAPAASEDRTRQLWNTQFLKARPEAGRNRAATTTPAPAAAAAASGEALVGVTVWRLRPSQPGDDQSVRVISSTTREEWTPLRFGSRLPLNEGERVRVSIEAARTGYLYVIDREQYADGSLGPPYLIFPTLRINSGNNAVRGGRVVEIPALDDSPPYFSMRKSRPDQVAEVLTIIVSPQPLPGVTVDRAAQRLEPAQVQEWVKQWGAKVERLESATGAGTAYSRSEKEAGADRTRLLTHEEPLPQTMYRVETRPGDPILLDVPLQLAQ